jgi:hypothetical protein
VQWIVRLTLGCTLLVTFRTFPSFSASFAAPLRNDLADHPTDGGLNALGFPTEPRRRGYYKARLGACLLDSDRGPHPRVDAALELVKAWSETRQLLLRTRRQENRTGGRALRSLGQPDVERWNKSASKIGDLGERMASAAPVGHPNRRPLRSGQVGWLVPPRGMSNQDTVWRNGQRRRE